MKFGFYFMLGGRQPLGRSNLLSPTYVFPYWNATHYQVQLRTVPYCRPYKDNLFVIGIQTYTTGDWTKASR